MRQQSSMISFAALLLLLPSAEAGAAGSSLFCTKLSDLQEKVQNCEQNDYYAEAGVNCLRAFEARAKAASASLNLNTSASAQNQTFQRTQADLDKSKLAVSALITEGALRLKEILAYTRNINLPEDADNPTLVGGDIRKFLQGSQCYKRAASVLESTMENMQKNIKKLQATRDALGALSAETGARSKGLDSGANKAAATGGKAAPSPKLPSGKQTGKDSQVTGIEEDMRKQTLPPAKH